VARYPNNAASVTADMKTILVALGLLVIAAVSACGATPAPAASTTFLLHQSDAGKTFNVRGGDTVRIILTDNYPVPGSSLKWNVAGAPESVLQPGAVTRSPQVRSGPGRTDTYTADFLATAAGQAVLSANGATTCEAMAKQNCPDQHFTITVVVRK
jgi:FtsP/CotA-like multicopper oxidase with cupredoxin domain